jgi:hypothetical protein
MEFDERRYRPLSTVDLFDEAFDLYKRNFVLFLSIAALIVVPTTIFGHVYFANIADGFSPQGGATDDPSTNLSIYLNQSSLMLRELCEYTVVSLPGWTLMSVAMVSAVAARYLDRPITVTQAYLTGVRRFVPALLTAVFFYVFALLGFGIMALSFDSPDLAPLLLFLGIVVEFITGFFALGRLSLYLGPVVVEKAWPFALQGSRPKKAKTATEPTVTTIAGNIGALARSSALSKDHGGRIVWNFILVWLITALIVGGLEALLELLTGRIASSAYLVVPMLAQNKQLASDLASGIAGLIMTPFQLIVITLLYFDQRVRKEGYDMEILADRLGYRPVAVPQAAYAPALTSRKRGRK